MDDQQRARELRKQAAKILADAYNDAHFYGAMDDALSETPSPHCQVTITAITAALRAAPGGFVMVPVEPTAEMLQAAAFGVAGKSGQKFKPMMEAGYAAMLAARPQGVK